MEGRWEKGGYEGLGEDIVGGWVEAQGWDLCRKIMWVEAWDWEVRVEGEKC